MGWQPNYQSEGIIYAQYMIKNKPNGKIAILYQNDDYGKDYLKGFKDGLGDKTKQIVSELSYEVDRPDRRLADRGDESVGRRCVL